MNTERHQRIQFLKQVVLEWIVTNGSLPGFQDRVNASIPAWGVVGPKEMTVYRGQGHSKPGIPIRSDPTTLLDGIRPIVATTKSMDVAKLYMGEDCCLFEIQVSPGIRYVDVKELFTFYSYDNVKREKQQVTNVSNDTIDQLLTNVATMPDSYWLKKATLEGKGRTAVRTLFLKRVHQEDEILLDGSQGGFTVTPHMFKATYRSKGHGRTLGRMRKGRGRTFRTKALRRNKKNGRRLTHKSQNGRYRRTRDSRDPNYEL